ncbi:MAG: ABC transporter permease [Syntrophobacter sp.]
MTRTDCTGTALAAQRGAMGVNEKIDALKTLDISPMNFLVRPPSDDGTCSRTAALAPLCRFDGDIGTRNNRHRSSGR